MPRTMYTVNQISNLFGRRCSGVCTGDHPTYDFRQLLAHVEVAIPGAVALVDADIDLFDHVVASWEISDGSSSWAADLFMPAGDVAVERYEMTESGVCSVLRPQMDASEALYGFFARAPMAVQMHIAATTLGPLLTGWEPPADITFRVPGCALLTLSGSPEIHWPGRRAALLEAVTTGTVQVVGHEWLDGEHLLPTPLTIVGDPLLLRQWWLLVLHTLSRDAAEVNLDSYDLTSLREEDAVRAVLLTREWELSVGQLIDAAKLL